MTVITLDDYNKVAKTNKNNLNQMKYYYMLTKGNL